jgi:hypothetical protein
MHSSLKLWTSLLLLQYQCIACLILAQELPLSKQSFIINLDLHHIEPKAFGRRLLKRSGIMPVLGAVRIG